MASATNDIELPHHCPPRFRHAEMTTTVKGITTVKGTVMCRQNFSHAEIGHWQPPQQANTDMMRRQHDLPLHN